MRDVAGEFPLDEQTVFIAGQSLARQLGREKNLQTVKFVTGRDTRESGGWLEAAFRAGAESENGVCISAGVMTTPGVALLTQDLKAEAGIVISASHNPFYDNGIKIFDPTGRKINEKIERQIELDIFEKVQSPESKVQSQKTESQKPKTKNQFTETELHERYLNSLRAKFPALSLHNLKITIDCANGAASNFAPQLFESFGASVTAVSNQPDGRNINKDCGSLHLDKLQAEVLAEKADFGVAYDGDADRSLFCDSGGNLIDGDAILWIMAKHFQNSGRLKDNVVISTVMSNLGLEVALKSRGIKLVRTQVGDKYVLEELLKTDARLGGEQSGHIIFRDFSLVGDGLLTTLFLLATMQENQSSLAELVTGFVRFPQILVNVPVREKIAFESVPVIAEVTEKVCAELGEKGRLVLRYSGTEPLARVMIEGGDQKTITNQANRIAAAIKTELG